MYQCHRGGEACPVPAPEASVAGLPSTQQDQRDRGQVQAARSSGDASFTACSECTGGLVVEYNKPWRPDEGLDGHRRPGKLSALLGRELATSRHCGYRKQGAFRPWRARRDLQGGASRVDPQACSKGRRMYTQARTEVRDCRLVFQHSRDEEEASRAQHLPRSATGANCPWKRWSDAEADGDGLSPESHICRAQGVRDRRGRHFPRRWQIAGYSRQHASHQARCLWWATHVSKEPKSKCPRESDGA
mmetsp:Transcript_66018/g.154522  ORF Transcript_66018/g.154522 Transcript_66018/m.154522 type:complete len:246 (-) Transcript_66018:909-1646(-)